MCFCVCAIMRTDVKMMMILRVKLMVKLYIWEFDFLAPTVDQRASLQVCIVSFAHRIELDSALSPKLSQEMYSQYHKVCTISRQCWHL